MSKKNRPLRVGICGCYTDSDAYPNVRYFIRSISRDARFEVVIKHNYQYQKIHYAKAAANVFHTARHTWTLLRQSLQAAVDLTRLLRRRDLDMVYVPYPGYLVLFFARLFWWGKRHPQLYCDAFISLHDTLVNDRQLVSRGGVPAALIHWLERLGYRFADRVLLDTSANKTFMEACFGGDSKKWLPLPLFIDEQTFHFTPYQRKEGEVYTVLFFGSFVPLHGIESIIAAADYLRDDPRFCFHIIGFGQTDGELAKHIEDLPNTTWECQWKSSAEIYAAICAADICLGIFGGTSKAARVWPFKNYLAMAVGRCIVSMQSFSGVCQEDGTYLAVPPADGPALATALCKLVDENSCAKYATAAHDYYNHHLANRVGLDILQRELTQSG